MSWASFRKKPVHDAAIQCASIVDFVVDFVWSKFDRFVPRVQGSAGAADTAVLRMRGPKNA